MDDKDIGWGMIKWSEPSRYCVEQKDSRKSTKCTEMGLYIFSTGMEQGNGCIFAKKRKKQAKSSMYHLQSRPFVLPFPLRANKVQSTLHRRSMWFIMLDAQWRGLIENGLKRGRTLQNSETEWEGEGEDKDHASPERLVQGHRALAFSRMD